MSENIFLSESITDTDIETWYLQDVLISADTGYGKTHFIKTKLYEYAKKRKQKILLLLPRKSLKNQNIKQIKKEGKLDVISITGYHVIENIVKHNIYKRQQEMINAIDSMAGKLVQKVQEETEDPVTGELEEVEQKPDKNNVAEGNPTPDPPKVSDKDSIKDAVLVDPDEPKKKPNKTKTGNNKAEVGDKVTYASGVYHAASDGSGRTGNYYLGKKVKITRINKGSKYPYCIDASDGTELGWVKLSQLKGYASGSKSIPSDQYGWTQELGTESLIRKRDGAIVTPFERGDMVLDADATKNLWDMMNDPSGFINGTMPDISQTISRKDRLQQGNTTYNQKIEFSFPNVQNYSDFMRKAQRDRKFEKMICDMTTERMVGGSSLRKYRHSF